LDLEKFVFKVKRNTCRKEENNYVYPCRGRAEYAVVGIEKNGNKNDARANATGFYTPKIRVAFSEKYALDKGEKEHGKEEYFHVFPSRFVDGGKGGYEK
jgi:hypothetical protein